MTEGRFVRKRRFASDRTGEGDTALVFAVVLGKVVVKVERDEVLTLGSRGSRLCSFNLGLANELDNVFLLGVGLARWRQHSVRVGIRPLGLGLFGLGTLTLDASAFGSGVFFLGVIIGVACAVGD